MSDYYDMDDSADDWGNEPESPGGSGELAVSEESDDGWDALLVAVAAGGGLLASAFLGAVGTRLGEQSVQAVRDRLGQRGSRARTQDAISAAPAFLGAIRTLAAARPSDGGVLRLSTAHNAVVVVHPLLPAKAVAQFGRLDLADPVIADLTVTWESRVCGYNVHDIWVDSSDVWATSSKRVRVDDGRERVLRYVWNDRVLLWQRCTDEPWRPSTDAGGPGSLSD
ncbi:MULTISPECIES: hypothetical protein [unclassified Streptomyces]|uniref:hypothetical protein n=1 Tax=unclassified Streptomyces TaxID=2593676 RepID=UPI002E77E431|nr:MULTISPECIES: hypothetical protein [unclassified Streptomyces]MEE1760977.1 hypothetical protein [Streptomyces sp. SP18BB07]MEE1836170.1 hypothetical protein [Streptomyces sp. SP17KL33]